MLAGGKGIAQDLAKSNGYDYTSNITYLRDRIGNGDDVVITGVWCWSQKSPLYNATEKTLAYNAIVYTDNCPKI